MRARKLTGVETDLAGSRRVIEVAAQGVSDHGAKLLKRFRLRKNGVAEGPRFVSTFGRFFNAKDNFRVGHHRVRASLPINVTIHNWISIPQRNPRDHNLMPRRVVLSSSS